MKFSVLLIFSILTIFGSATGELKLPQEIVELLKNLSATCKDETGVPENLVEDMKKGKLADDPKAKCYLKCMMMQLQAMKEDGHLDTELIEATMPDALKMHGGLETVHKCKHIHNPDLCETAYELMVCFKKENPALTDMFD